MAIAVPSVVVPILLIGFGVAWFFFAGRLIDWQIRILQSRSYRTLYRVLGLVLAAVGVVFMAIAIGGPVTMR
jgi:small neutral amino acid transporter SnatA (MarC family)